MCDGKVQFMSGKGCVKDHLFVKQVCSPALRGYLLNLWKKIEMLLLLVEENMFPNIKWQEILLCPIHHH